MPKIVKLSDLSKKEREEILQQTKKEDEERRARIESEISFSSNNKSINNINLPPANKGNDISNIFKNFGYGLSNGLISLQQQFDRVTKKGINDRLSAGDKINSKLNLPTSQDMLKNMLGENYDKPITNIGEKIEKQKKTNIENIQKNIDNSSNIVTKRLSEVAPSVGQMLPGMLPGIGSTYFAGSASGNYYDEAKRRGMSEKEAEKYSAIMGLAEGGAEALGGKITKSIGKNLIKGKSKEALKMFGLDILENFAEEAIMEPLSEVTATVTAGKDKADWNNIGKRMLQSGLDGAIVATIMGGASAGVGSSVNIINKVSKGEEVTSNDINIAKNDLQNKMTDAEVQEKIKEAETIINSINKTELNNIVENNQETLYNNKNSYDNIKIGETRNIPIDEILKLQNRMGYRTEEQINGIREYVKQNGLQNNPIELVRNNDGTVKIEDGNHRLLIAKELGMKEVPVTFVESWENIGMDEETSEINVSRELEELYDRSNRYSKRIDGSNNKSGVGQKSWINNSDQFKNRSSTESNDRLSEGGYQGNQYSSNTATEKNIKQIEDSNKSSFNLTSVEKPTRREVIANNRNIAKKKIENIANWEDKSSGIKYQRETMERNMFDIIKNKEEAQDIVDTYFTPIHESEAQKQRFINKYNEEIRALDLNKHESEAVQLLGEQKYNPEFKSEDVQEIIDRVNENIEKGKVNKDKVNNAIEKFRSIYDELYDLENEALTANGYKEKPYRKGYFPHFIDAEPTTKTEKFLNKLGFKIDKRALPTDIAGITEQFVPGKTWNRSALERKTNKTTYNALQGFDTYISQASDNIFHTSNIQRLRALENEIRYQYSDKGIQQRIDEIYNDDLLTAEEQQIAIEKIFEQVENPMPNLVVELRRYTNALANKKSEADRSAEQKYGRGIYSTVNAIENRFGANAVGLNIASAITNFIPITQAYSQVSTKNMFKATKDTIKSYINDDGFINNSVFLTNRLNQSEKLYKTSLEKISDKTSFLFNAIDNVTSNIVVRGKYLQNIENGMSQVEAMKDANSFGAKVMADRSKGALPTLFNEKNPISKLFTQFQLEVNNQYSYMFKDVPRDLKEKGLANIALAFFKMFVASWLYNLASEKITGRKPAFDPIDIVVSSYKTLQDEDKTIADKTITVGKNIAEELPFVGGYLGGGRIPVSGALPDAENTYKAIVGLTTGEMDSKKALNTLGKELAKPAYYLLPPFGGSQAKKSIEGIKTVKEGGSYGVDPKGEKTLQFPVENAKVTDYIKAGLFGKYALPMAKEYTERGYKSLNAKQTKIYEESKLPYKELLNYIDQKLEKKEDKISYLEKQEMNEQQRWGIYKYDILSNKEREDGGSQLSDAEYITSNGVSKSKYIEIYNKAQKNDLDMPTEKEYKEMKSAGISLENYMNYKVKVKEETVRKKAIKELDEDGKLKNKDKIQVLLDSKYSDKEIGAIYENYIKQEKDTEYSIMEKSGVNVKEYLKYKQQDFESDKKEDGTLQGKTKTGSKKKKVINYLNSMDITGNQRLLLYAMNNYTTTASQKNQLVKYVQQLDMTSKEKLELYDKFSGFKVYKNGTIKW